MPLYEYECVSCGNIDEQLRMACKRDQPHHCIKCGKLSTRALTAAQCLVDKKCNKSKSAPKTVVSKQRKVSTGIHVTHGSQNIVVEGCNFEGFDVGISLPNKSKVEMKGNIFEGVKTPLQIRDD